MDLDSPHVIKGCAVPGETVSNRWSGDEDRRGPGVVLSSSLVCCGCTYYRSQWSQWCNLTPSDGFRTCVTCLQRAFGVEEVLENFMFGYDEHLCKTMYNVAR